MDNNKVNYCKADNKKLEYECLECSFFKQMDEDIYNFFEAYNQTLKALKGPF